ncbi:hypothetical protein C2869_04100 [Saccharobesus litoralis]|uniref:Probable membrane transporter protein n=1 Tax=Saccharobesus litoralis TaxID=2172099 RepID=A0A2S0VN65_9ALTE|nr:sulfite exporter TauE/SafE family protein [Saccharobesus litoralis]AWB65668.1 hypothetical protein C2869_04100 [Saccharobesus litoralis]
MAYEWILAYLALGAFVGFMAGLLGIGGGGIMVPMLTSLFLAQGIDASQVVHLALGTSMASIVVTSLSSLQAHHKSGAVLWPAVKSMAPGIVLGTFAATFIAAHAPSLYLAVFFSLFMGFTAVRMFCDIKPKASRQLESSKGLLAVGVGIGGISALVSIGGGSLTVPYLVSRNIDIKKAIGTSAAVGLPIALAGTLGFVVNGWSKSLDTSWTAGFVYLPAVLLISSISYFMAPIGAKLAHKLPVPALKKVFALLLTVLSLKMLWSVI